MVSYNVSFLKDIIINNNNNNNIKELHLTKLITNFNNETYEIYRYDKSKLDESNIASLGNVRSIVTHKQKIVAFSPPKSISLSSFESENNIKDTICS